MSATGTSTLQGFVRFWIESCDGNWFCFLRDERATEGHIRASMQADWAAGPPPWYVEQQLTNTDRAYEARLLDTGRYHPNWLRDESEQYEGRQYFHNTITYENRLEFALSENRWAVMVSSPWSRYVSRQDGDREYFHNCLTGETCWDLPSRYRPIWMRHECVQDEGRQYFHNTITGATSGEVPLREYRWVVMVPRPWKRYISRVHGDREYFHNCETRQTRWALPSYIQVRYEETYSRLQAHPELRRWEY